MRQQPTCPHPTVVLLLLALLLPLALPALAQGPPSRIEIRRGDEVIYSKPEPEGAVRVLFVGNSLTYFNEVPWLFSEIVGSRRPEPPVVARFSGASGMSLEQHWRREEALRLIRTQRWDYVVLQEQSARPLLDPESHRRYLERFVAEARRRGAAPVIFETWPLSTDHHKHPGLRARYRQLADELDVPLVPIRTAWETAIAAGIDLYRDTNHSNLAGAYLTACVLAAHLLDVDPRGAIHVFPVDFPDPIPPHRRSLARETLTPQQARRLQDLAWSTVRESRP